MRNKFKMFISFTLVIAMLTSCRSSSFDNSKHSSNMDGSLETSNDTLDISESNYSSTEDESEDNYDDYSSDELIEGKTQSFTVGDKSLPITLKKEKSTNGDLYTLSLGDKKYNIISEANISKYQSAQCFFVHKNKHDYIIASLEGKSVNRTTKVFKFTDSSSLEKVFEAKGYKYYDICRDFLLVSEKIDCFGTWEVAEGFYFHGKNDDSFDIEAGMIQDRIICNPKPLTLKKDVIFAMDYSEVEPRPLKAGDVIYPSYYEHHGYITFCDENGVSYGELSVNYIEENGKTVWYGIFYYDEEKNLYDADLYSEEGKKESVRIYESDLFEENYYED